MKPCKKCFHYNACITSNPDMVKKTFECNFFEYKEKIKSALEKQIPKKPITDKERMITIYRCGCGTHLATLCDKDVIVGTMQNYCSNCGQALDWSDTE